MTSFLKLRGIVLPLLLITICTVSEISNAQQHDKVWVFGRNAGLDFNILPPASFFFNNENPPFYGSSYEADANVCDENGELLFYTNGTHMYDKQQNIMPNGNNILPLTYLIPHTGSSSQGTIIIPFPFDKNKFYVFSLTCQELGADAGRLYYSVVDMTLNNGLGDVIASQRGVFIDDGFTEQMTAISGEECGVYWLILSSMKLNHFVTYRIDINGIDTANPVVSNSFVASPSFNYVGTITPNPNENKIVASQFTYSTYGGLYIYDINKLTGELTNEVRLDSFSHYSNCLSRDGSKVYFADGARVFQIDLNAGSLANIRASKIQLLSGISYTDLKLGIDDKIYFRGNALGGTSLGTIEFPNLAGMACQPQPNSIQLVTGSNLILGLPNVVPKNTFTGDTTSTSQEIKICKNSSYELSANIPDAELYNWDNGSTQKQRTVNSAGVYRVTYIKECTYYIDSFIISNFPTENSSSELYDSVCAYETYDFNGKKLTAPGNYTDSFKNIYDCDSVVTLHLSHKETPSVDFEFFMNDDICITDSIDATAHGNFDFHWYINTAFYSSDKNIKFPLNNVQTELTLVGTMENSCSSSVTKTIKVNVCCDLFIPNAFSPNGDGINDVFSPINYGKIHSYEFKIFNRFGEQVYSTSDMNAFWDGKFKGNPAEMGVYFYFVKGKCFDGSDFILKGDVTLLK